MDTDNTGFISPKELEEGLIRIGVEPAGDEIKEIIINTDVMGNGKINYTEFLMATIERKDINDDDQL